MIDSGLMSIDDPLQLCNNNGVKNSGYVFCLFHPDRFPFANKLIDSVPLFWGVRLHCAHHPPNERRFLERGSLIKLDCACGSNSRIFNKSSENDWKILGFDSACIIIDKHMGIYLGESCRCHQPVCDQSFRTGNIYGGPFLLVGTGCELVHIALIVEIFNNTVYPAIAQRFIQCLLVSNRFGFTSFVVNN